MISHIVSCVSPVLSGTCMVICTNIYYECKISGSRTLSFISKIYGKIHIKFPQKISVLQFLIFGNGHWVPYMIYTKHSGNFKPKYIKKENKVNLQNWATFPWVDCLTTNKIVFDLYIYPTRARGRLFTDLTINLYGGTSADLSKIPPFLGGIVICFRR